MSCVRQEIIALPRKSFKPAPERTYFNIQSIKGIGQNFSNSYSPSIFTPGHRLLNVVSIMLSLNYGPLLHRRVYADLVPIFGD